MSSLLLRRFGTQNKLEKNRTDPASSSASIACVSAVQADQPSFKTSNLIDAISRHLEIEIISFHTPGHKGRLASLSPQLNESFRSDLTELPGLDELSNPQTTIKHIEDKAAALWGSRKSFISLGGATHCIMSAILAAASNSSKKVLVPRNAHRSVLEALCLADLEPIWYEPSFDEEFNTWSQTAPQTIEECLSRLKDKGEKAALVIVVSPTYTGKISDIAAIKNVTSKFQTMLLVDEAHGAHFLSAPSAVQAGADLVAHSLHKTLSGLTQTGILHVGKDCPLSDIEIKSTLSRLTSTSPSYLLLASIEAAIDLLSSLRGKELLDQLLRLGKAAQENIAKDKLALMSKDSSATHIFLKPIYGSGSTGRQSAVQELTAHLESLGIYAEAQLGAGLLFMLGIGSQEADIDCLISALRSFNQKQKPNPKDNTLDHAENFSKPQPIKSLMTPYQASSQEKLLVKAKDAENRVSAEFFAPCPPGIPLLVPGQLISKEVLESTQKEQFLVVA